MDLPTGTVTFCFTDIEGSTRLWERYPEAMSRALARHDSLAEALIAEHGGTLVKSRGEGDSLFAVFARATDALAAACDLQRAFHAEPWSEYVQEAGGGRPEEQGFALRVRLALHSGEADLRAGDYYGAAVNRCARLRDSAHGGQTLLSQTTYELVRDALPEEVHLIDLGEQHLRDLARPEYIFQLAHPELPADFPPLRLLAARPNNLPQQVTSFVGREREMAEVKRLLTTTRLLTLTGPGGAGKTRLSLQVAGELLDEYPDGVWLAELAPLSDPALLPQAVATALGVREEPGRPLTETLLSALKAKKLLLVLDNCEHLLGACATLADRILRACAAVRLLCSSRAALGIAGETLYRVPMLTLPDLKHLPPVERLSQYEAIHLFIERAVAAVPGFTVTAQNAPAIVQICCQLDGIPLAIELAAARSKALPVEQIAARLDARFRLLTGGSRAALPRQQTLRALFDWSYDLLSEPERELFRRLSVFIGGFTLEAAEAVCADSPSPTPPRNGEELFTPPPAQEGGQGVGIEAWEVLDLLSQLVDKSLAVAEGQNGNLRYHLLETLRQYGREKLAASGRLEEMQRRHLAYFLRIAEEAERKLRGSEQAWWLELLETEHDNLRAALRRCLAAEGDAEAGLRLAGALWWFWHIRGYFTEGREWLDAMLARVTEPTAARAKALNGAAVLARNQSDYAAARALAQESLAIKRELGDLQGIASSLSNLGTLALSQGDYAAARPFYQESLDIERSLGNRQGITASLIGLGNVALEQGDYTAARALFQESLAIKRELGDKRGVATSLVGLGSVAFLQGDYESARALYAESLALRRNLGDKRGIATSLQHLGSVAIASGDLNQAARLLEESLILRRELGDKLGIANTLYAQGMSAWRRADYAAAHALFQESLTLYRELENRRGIASALQACGFLAASRQLPERAARLLGAAQALREAIHVPLAPVEQADYEPCVVDVSAMLGAEAFAAIWAEGRALSQEQAVAYALETPTSHALVVEEIRRITWEEEVR